MEEPSAEAAVEVLCVAVVAIVAFVAADVRVSPPGAAAKGVVVRVDAATLLFATTPPPETPGMAGLETPERVLVKTGDDVVKAVVVARPWVDSMRTPDRPTASTRSPSTAPAKKAARSGERRCKRRPMSAGTALPSSSSARRCASLAGATSANAKDMRNDVSLFCSPVA